MSNVKQESCGKIPVRGRSAEHLSRQAFGYDDIESFCADIPKGSNLLDIGSGESNFGYEVARRRPDVTVVALDLEYGEKRPDYMAQNQPNFTALAGEATDLPFADKSFDTITSYWLLPHLSLVDDSNQKLTQATAEVVRVLNHKGRALLGPANQRKHRGLIGDITTYNETLMSEVIAERLAMRGIARKLQAAQNKSAEQFFGTGRWIHGDTLLGSSILDPDTGEYVRLLSAAGARITLDFGRVNIRNLIRQ